MQPWRWWSCFLVCLKYFSATPHLSSQWVVKIRDSVADKPSAWDWSRREGQRFVKPGAREVMAETQGTRLHQQCTAVARKSPSSRTSKKEITDMISHPPGHPATHPATAGFGRVNMMGVRVVRTDGCELKTGWKVGNGRVSRNNAKKRLQAKNSFWLTSWHIY